MYAPGEHRLYSTECGFDAFPHLLFQIGHIGFIFAFAFVLYTQMNLEDADIAKLASDNEMSDGVKRYSLVETTAQRLRILSEELTGIRFNID